jgi:hypothetical protein
MPLLAQLQKESEQQKRQFIHFVEHIHQITQKVNKLQEFDRKINRFWIDGLC